MRAARRSWVSEGGLRELRANPGIDELFEGPGWCDAGAGLEGDFDQGFASTLAEAFERDAAGFGHCDGFAAEKGGEFEEILLERLVRRGIVTTGALHFDAQKGRADDETLCGHGNVVL
jgi:hypothetical protein